MKKIYFLFVLEQVYKISTATTRSLVASGVTGTKSWLNK